MEENLDLIAKGEISRDKTLFDFYNPFILSVNNFKENCKLSEEKLNKDSTEP